jgi:hypothetical protein
VVSGARGGGDACRSAHPARAAGTGGSSLWNEFLFVNLIRSSQAPTTERLWFCNCNQAISSPRGSNYSRQCPDTVALTTHDALEITFLLAEEITKDR